MKVLHLASNRYVYVRIQFVTYKIDVISVLFPHQKCINTEQMFKSKPLHELIN